MRLRVDCPPTFPVIWAAEVLHSEALAEDQIRGGSDLIVQPARGLSGTITPVDKGYCCGAGDENRTRMASLEDETREALARRFPFMQRKELTLISPE
jgi:hypothetical protein